MARAFHAGVLLFVAAGCAGLSRLSNRDLSRQSLEPTRWFVPGIMGLERGGLRVSDSRVRGKESTAGLEASRESAGGVVRLANRNAAEPLAGRGFLTRAISGLQSPEAFEWGRRNGLGGRLPFSHNLAHVFPPGLAKTRPEFFPLEKGRRLQPPPGSGFWNPDIARPDAAQFAADAARSHFEAHPDAVSFALGVNDALIWGESPELIALTTPLRWFRERPDYSNLVFTFMNRAAEELSRTHPDKYLGALAYYWCEAVPDFPLHPRVIPFLTADRSQGYDAAFWKEEMELQESWGKLRTEDGGQKTEVGDQRTEKHESASGIRALSDTSQVQSRLGMYDYLYGVGFLIPRIHTQLLAKNLRHAWQAGFTDYYAEIAPNWGLDPITPWLTAQLLQDPEQPAAVLLDEFFGRYFREAAGPMRRFFERCEEQWMRQPGPSYWLKHFRNESQAIVFPSAVTAELRAILAEAERTARSGRVRERVRLVSETFGVTERFVAFKEARDTLIRLSLPGKGPAAGVAGKNGGIADFREVLITALGKYLWARRDFTRYTLDLMRAEPLALAPFGWDDFLKNDPVPLAVSALRAQLSDADFLAILAHPDVGPLWDALERFSRMASNAPGGSGPSVELLRNPGMEGTVLPPRMIAGLTYSVPMPAEWRSRVEPAEHHEAKFIGGGNGRTLLVRGTKETVISQWVPLDAATDRTRSDVPAEIPQFAEVAVRGRVSPSTAVSLMIAWLDEQHRHVGFKSVRLPDGEWPDYVTLRQAGVPPPRAAWVGMGLRIQHQVAGDWIEAREFSLHEPAHPVHVP